MTDSNDKLCPETKRIFLSHASKNRELANKLYSVLEQVFGDEVTIFYSRHIEKGGGWRNEVIENLSKSDTFIVVVTEESMTSPWVLFECGYFYHVCHGKHIYMLMHNATPVDPIKEINGGEFNRTDLHKTFETICGNYGIEYKRTDHEQAIKDLIKVANNSKSPRVIDGTFARFNELLDDKSDWEFKGNPEKRLINPYHGYQHTRDPRYGIEITKTYLNPWNHPIWVKRFFIPDSDPTSYHSIDGVEATPIKVALTFDGKAREECRFYHLSEGGYLVAEPLGDENQYHYLSNHYTYKLSEIIGFYGNDTDHPIKHFAERAGIIIDPPNLK